MIMTHGLYKDGSSDYDPVVRAANIGWVQGTRDANAAFNRGLGRPEPDLSGEFAGTMSGPALAELVEAELDDFGSVCDAYEERYLAAVDRVYDPLAE